MKRLLLIISSILLCFALRAQSVTYTCRYWFDQNDTQAVTATFSEDIWQAELDVGAFTKGLHTLHVQAADTSSAWCPTLSYLFIKMSPTEPLMDSVDMSNLTYHCWFDKDDAHQQTGVLGNGIFLFDVDDLDDGLHSLNIMLEGSTLTSTLNYLFIKVSEHGPLIDPVDMSNLTYHYWFDEDHAHQQTGALGNGVFLFDVSELEEGLHSVNIMLEGSTLTSTQNYLFVKVAQQAPLIDPVDMSNLTYHCWFDKDDAHQQTGALGNGVFLFDVDDLDDGLHSLNIMLEGSTLTSTLNYLFIKVSEHGPLIEPIDMSELTYHCWFDLDYENRVTAPISNGIMLLDVDNIGDGLHTVHILLEGEAMTSTLTYMFLKKPEHQDFGIAKWQYFLNGDVSQIHTTEFSPLIDTLDIITLLPVETWPVRSSCFHFHPNGDAPYLNAKNEVTFRFWSNDDRVLQKSAFYIDYQVQHDIVASVFERNTTETFAAPHDNQIQWFKLDAVVGDSLAFVADKACTMQLFAPSGEEVYSATASEAMVFGGCHAWEDGTYYLAVHDMTGSGEQLSVTYNWIAKYIVLEYTPTEIGNTWGVFEMDVLGNGFDKLNNVILVNGSIEWQMDSIMYSHISEGAIRFAMDAATSNGNYDVVLCFEDQFGELDTLVLPNAIQVVEAQFGTIDIEYSYQFNTTPPYLITVTVTNNGNVEYQGVPVLFAHTNINNVSFNLYNDWIYVQEDYFENGGRGIYYTNNLFNQGIEGNIIPLVLPKLGPYGTREITFVVDADRGTEFDFYAWGGIPWSVKTQEAYDADAYYCQTHPESPGWGGVHYGNGGDSGWIYGGGSSGGAHYTIGLHNERAGNTHRIASDAFYDSCHGLPDFCQAGGSLAECICGEFGATGATLQNAVGAGVGLYHRAQLEALGSNFDYIADSDYGQHLQRSAYHRRLRTPGSLLRDAIGHCTSLLPEEAQQTADNALEAWGLLSDDCVEPPHQRPSIPRPCEPNEIRGYVAESGSHYMMQEIQTITYEIESENDTTATAAAHTIIVRDTLDFNKFDVASLAAYRVTIHDKVLELSGEHNFVYTLDLRPNVYVIAQIQLECDDETGIVVWTITSLDPMTMEPTTDPNQGALPINYNGEGIATFTFNVNLKEPFPDGTEISNRVGIIFDLEEPVITDTWTNIVDAVKPISHIEEVTTMADSLNFVFVSQDNRSGVWYHSLYYRNASTEQEWQVRKAQIFEDSFVLHLEDLLTTEYLVIAVDSAGNREDKDMVAEYIYTASGLHFVTEGNWSTASNWQGGALPAADDVVFIEAPCQLDQNATVAALNVSNGQSLTLQSGNTLTVTGNLTNTVAANLVIEDGAQLVNASENVAATVKKDVTAYGIGNPSAWHTIASPVSGMSIAGSGFVTPEYDLYRYNETNLIGEEWENYKANLADFTTFEKGRGYLFANSNSFSPVFIGTLNNMDVTCSLTYTNRPNDPLSGFNLVGNPFPHNIYKGAGAAIDNANLASGYYTLTNEGVWQAHTYEDAILPGQGILVKTNAPTTLTIAKSNVEATSESSEAERSKGSLSISIAGDNGQDQAYVYFGQGIGLDKVKSIALDAPSLAVRNGNGDFAIAHCDKKSDAVELVFTTRDEGSFTMDVNVVAGDFDYLHLIDSLTGDDVDLLATPSYTFEASARDDASRFRLVFSIKGN